MRPKPNAQAPEQPSLIGVLVLTGLMGWATIELGPLLVAGQVQLLPAMTGVIAVLGVMRLVITLLGLLARLFDWMSAHSPTQKEGSARWGTAKDLHDEA